MARLKKRFGAKLNDTFLRIEHVRDTDGFRRELPGAVRANPDIMLLRVSSDRRTCRSIFNVFNRALPIELFGLRLGVLG